MAIVGTGGLVKIGSDTVADIKSWKLNASKAMLDVTSFGDTWKKNLTGLGEWSADCEGQWVIATDTNGQTAIQTAFLAGTSITLKLYVDATHYYSGTAYISKIDPGTAVDGVVTISLSFTGSGVIAYN